MNYPGKEMKLFERMLLGAVAMAAPAVLIAMLMGSLVAGPKALPFQWFIIATLISLGATLAAYEFQPFKWLEEKLGL